MENIYASDGTILPIDSMAVTIANNVDGTVNYMEVSESGNTYRQTFTYDTGLLVGISNWVLQ